MNKEIEYVKNLQKALDLITNGTQELNQLAHYATDKIIQDKLLSYVANYAQLSYSLSVFLIRKIIEIINKYSKDKNDFNNLMKDFE
jgi:hypothetical protein